MSDEVEKPVDEMTRDEKLAAGYRPMRCTRCRGAGIEWNARKRRGERCPQCAGAKFFWVKTGAPRDEEE